MLFLCWSVTFFEESRQHSLLVTILYAYRCTRSPLVPCMSRRAHSGRRTSFRGRVGFIELYTYTELFYFLIIDLFIFNIKGLRLSS
jgi:hypothetical protein